jgi:hypothetical protein
MRFFSSEVELKHKTKRPKPTNAIVKGIRYMAKLHFGKEFIRTHCFVGERNVGLPGLRPGRRAEMEAITGKAKESFIFTHYYINKYNHFRVEQALWC